MMKIDEQEQDIEDCDGSGDNDGDDDENDDQN